MTMLNINHLSFTIMKLSVRSNGIFFFLVLPTKMFPIKTTYATKLLNEVVWAVFDA